MKKHPVSNRLLKVPASPIRKLVPFATEAKKEGVKVYHLNIGDPDIKTPDAMISFLRDWSKNPVGYSQSQGEPEFLKSLEFYYSMIGFHFINTADIQVTTGGSEAISMALFAICDEGDEVMVFEPFYTNYNSYAAVNNVNLVPVKTDGRTGFHLPDRSEIENKITPKTKAILICNPSNPTGTVYTREEMDLLVELAKKHNLFLISDEVYREFVYDGKRHISLLEYMEALPEQTIMLDSLSKRYSLCGARLGMLVSKNREVMEGVLRIAQGRLSSGLVDQLMASKLTEVKDSYFEAVHNEYQKRRNVLYEGLKSIPGVYLEKPEGAFYTIVKLPVKNADHFSQWLLTDFRLNNETVMVAPAAGFYATSGLGLDEVRIAYVLNTEDLKKSIEVLRHALKAYSSS
ncbi:MAG: pyridoxal phosphate-dependent aminotransferase [Patescibacteria group bacterium]